MTEFFEKMQKDLEKGSDRQKLAEDDMREYLRLTFEKTNQTVLVLQTRDHSMAELRKSEPGVEGETFSRSVIWQAMERGTEYALKFQA